MGAGGPLEQILGPKVECALAPFSYKHVSENVSAFSQSQFRSGEPIPRGLRQRHEGRIGRLTPLTNLGAIA